jgi:hypothetical protein
VLSAVGSFLYADATRLLAVVAQLRRTHALVEMRLGGASMVPTIDPDTRIQVRLTDREVRPGDVIVFMSGDRWVVHRVLYRPRRGRARAYLLSKGDAVRLPDPPVRREQVVGVVTAIWQASSWHALPAPVRRPPLARATALASMVAAAMTLAVSPEAAESVLTYLQGRRRG